MWKEFKEFAFKGNVVDMAVGVIIGGAFGTIVTSLVNDVVMPAVGILIGKIDFTTLQWNGIMYGNFIQAIVNFMIIAVCIFFFVKLANKLRNQKDETKIEAKESSTEILLTEIRDLLKEKK